MKTYRAAILGATGAVGREMLAALRNFPLSELRLLSGARSAGSVLDFGGTPLRVQQAEDSSFAGLDFVLGAAEADVAVRFAPAIREAGAVFIDNSSAFRLRDDVPLVIPEINPEDALCHSGVISNPNCTTIISLVALHGLHRLSPLERIVASTYQAVSGAGAGGIAELLGQMDALRNGVPVQPEVFPRQIVCNVIPKIGSASEGGYTSEELKLRNESRKILHSPGLLVNCTCVRVPVLRSHSVSLLVRTRERISLEAAREAISAASGCRLVDDLAADAYPTPLESSDGDLVLVGRIREDPTDERSLSLFCCGDQLRRGAATNAVRIAALLFGA